MCGPLIIEPLDCKIGCSAQNLLGSFTSLLAVLSTKPLALQHQVGFARKLCWKVPCATVDICTYSRAIRSVAAWHIVDDLIRQEYPSPKRSVRLNRAWEEIHGESNSTWVTQSHCLAKCLWSGSPYCSGGRGEAGKMWGPCVFYKPKTDHHPNTCFFHRPV